MTTKTTKCKKRVPPVQPDLPRSKYLVHTLQLTLEEMFSGTVRKLAVNKNVECIVCHGDGLISEDIAPEYNTCEECGGMGFIHTIIRRSAPSADEQIEEQIERECELCWGKGETIIPEQRCLHCFGRKTVPDQSMLIVNVRPGSRHGQKIIFECEGTQEPKMRPGNIYVILEQLEHPVFKREGDDLVMTMPLDLVESLCGFEKVVTTLDKRQVTISIPRGKVVKTNDVKYLNGEGMPNYKKPNERGKLFIQFDVNLPPAIRARHVPSLEQCLPPRERIDIPMHAVECNMINMAPAGEEETYEEQMYQDYDPNDG